MKKTERLEVRISPVHYNLLQTEAKRRGVSMGGLVREAVEEKYGDIQTQRMEAFQQLITLDLPVDDWEQMKREIEAGYLSDLGMGTEFPAETGSDREEKAEH